jgi:flagellar hook-length control protein FliK
MQDPAAPAPADGALSKTPTAAQLVSVPLVLRPDLKPSPAAPASSGAVSALGSTASSAPGGLATAPGTTGPAAGAPADPASTGNRNVRPGPAQPLAAAKAAPEAEAPRGVRANRPTSAPAPSGTPAHPTPEAAAAVTPQLTPSPSPATSVSAPSSVAAASVPAAQPALETALAHVRTRPSGTHELTVELHPADLGAVRVIARLSGDQLDVTVLCADHAAQQAVAAAVPTLHDRLSELKHVDITDFGGPSNQPAGSFGDTSHGRPQGGGDRHPTVVQDEPADRRTNNEGPVKQTRRAAGADGRLDRRI